MKSCWCFDINNVVQSGLLFHVVKYFFVSVDLFRLCVTTWSFAVRELALQIALIYIQGVSGGIVNILGGGSMNYSE